MKSLMAKLMALVMVLSIAMGHYVAADSRDWADDFVDALVAARNTDEFVALLELFVNIEDQSGLLTAYSDAFLGLVGEGSPRLESMDQTLLAVAEFTNFFDERFTIQRVRDYLEDGDLEGFKTSIREAAGDRAFSGFGSGMDHIDTLFTALKVFNRPLFRTPYPGTIGGSLTLYAANAQFLDTVASVLFNNIMNSVSNNFNDFVAFYNAASSTDRIALYNYLNQFRLIQVLPQPQPATVDPVITPATTPTGPAAIDEVIIEDEETPLALMPFIDVDHVPWAHEAILALFIEGIVRGKTATLFAPDDSITRAEFANLIARLFDLIDLDRDYISAFEDVDEDAWYQAGITAAYEAGFVLGVGHNRYEPERTITRQELGTVIGRILLDNGHSLPNQSEYMSLLEVFFDYEEIAEWALDGAVLSADKGIIKGRAEFDLTRFAPTEDATRAEAVVMLYRMAAFVDTVLSVDEVVED